MDEQGRGLTLDDLIAKGYTAKEVRYWLLSVHYRKPVTFSFERLDDACRSLKRLNRCIHTLLNMKAGPVSHGDIAALHGAGTPHVHNSRNSKHPQGAVDARHRERRRTGVLQVPDNAADAVPCECLRDINQIVYDIKNDFITAMDDDMNVSAAMASLFRQVKAVNRLCHGNELSTDDASLMLEAFRRIDSVLNVLDFDQQVSNEDVRDLILRRKRARAARNWAEADRLREKLTRLGVDVRDRRIDE